MATNGGTVRDAAARRRRIAERGAERLALITGRAQSLSSSPVPPAVQSDHSSTAPTPPSNSDHLPPSDENTDPPLNTEPAVDNIVSDVQRLMHNDETITEIATKTTFEPNKLQSFPTTLTQQNPPPMSTLNKPQKPKSQNYLQETLTPNRLRPAITSSQNIRKTSSLIIALLVLLSYAGFPILGNNTIKGIILSRPLVLLILTNITIVIAPVLLEKVERRGSLTGDAGFGNNLGLALEWGMLMKTGLSDLFMDCSVYSVLLVCGMSVLQKFGW